MRIKTIIHKIEKFKSFIYGKITLERIRGTEALIVEVTRQNSKGMRRLLWSGPERKVKTLLRFSRGLGAERCQRLSYVCSDMWAPYLKVIRKKAPAGP